jgi:ADP-ribose pyrophosphatase
LKSWKTISKQIILKHSDYLTVENHTIKLPDGQVITDWPWIITPDYVIIVAVTVKGKYICFRQTKYGVEGTSIAPVGGYIEPEEAPLSAAKRELLEETGYEATEWVNLGKYRVDGNRGAGMAHIYLAGKAKYVKKPDAEDQEEQELLLLNRSEVESFLLNKEYKVLPWVTAGAMALLYLDNDE